MSATKLYLSPPSVPVTAFEDILEGKSNDTNSLKKSSKNLPDLNTYLKDGNRE